MTYGLLASMEEVDDGGSSGTSRSEGKLVIKCECWQPFLLVRQLHVYYRLLMFLGFSGLSQTE